MANFNEFQLKGGGLSVTYFPAGHGPSLPAVGRDSLTYQKGNVSKTFAVGDVTVSKTTLGTLASVVLANDEDGPSDTFVLVLPTDIVPIPDNPNQADITGLGIVVVAEESVSGPLASERYRVTTLKGTARDVLVDLTVGSKQETPAH